MSPHGDFQPRAGALPDTIHTYRAHPANGPARAAPQQVLDRPELRLYSSLYVALLTGGTQGFVPPIPTRAGEPARLRPLGAGRAVTRQEWNKTSVQESYWTAHEPALECPSNGRWHRRNVPDGLPIERLGYQ